MSWITIRKERTVNVRVWSKKQKIALVDCLDGYEMPKLMGYTSKYIDYQIKFDYSANYKAFMFNYKGLYRDYKFQILSVQ